MKKFLVLLASVYAFGANCVVCHNGMYKPSLSNYTAQEIKTALLKYRKSNSDDVMTKIAQKLSTQEIEKLAKQYGKK
ncbi:MAG: hypothetical protein GXO40_02785 [Epsilonproteobacteria bacterium]|nr:hypothetical protein [Campylobacterota bacterium]